MKIAMIASEANPLCKTGGLADVVYALTKELGKMGEEAIVLLPYYATIAKLGYPLEFVANFEVPMNWRRPVCDLWTCVAKGVRFYLVGNGRYFARDSLYGYEDDGERFAFFALASIEAMKRINFQPDIVHAHDWQAGMVPTLLKVAHSHNETFKKTKTVLTIHNPAFKGILDPSSLFDLYNLPYELYENGRARFQGVVSTLKAGIVDANKVTTVSPTHREELLSPVSEFGLDGVLRMRAYDFCGFVNGIDIEEWNPKTDPRLVKNYDASTLKEGKKANKEAFLKENHLATFDGPLFGLVSRLTYQKGIDLVLNGAEEILARGGLIAILGSGDKELEEKAKWLQERHPSQVYVYEGYSNDLAHKIYASSDFFLMPSLFEPCGIGQLLAEAYGSLPVARDVGGLHDTIKDSANSRIRSGEATGILFHDYNEEGFRYAFSKAFEIYKNKALCDCMRKNAMNEDHSWRYSAELYLGLYKELNS